MADYQLHAGAGHHRSGGHVSLATLLGAPARVHRACVLPGGGAGRPVRSQLRRAAGGPRVPGYLHGHAHAPHADHRHDALPARSSGHGHGRGRHRDGLRAEHRSHHRRGDELLAGMAQLLRAARGHHEARALVGSRRGFDGDGRRSGKRQHATARATPRRGTARPAQAEPR